MSARLPADVKRVRILVTPEGVSLPLELADMGQRAGAFMLDLLIMLGVVVGFTLLLLAAGLTIGQPLAFRAIAVLWLTGAFFVRNFYFTWFESRPRGRTPGKRALGIRVIARHGGRLTLDAVIARNALREVEIFLPLSFLGMSGVAGGVAAWIVICGLIWSGTFLFLPLMNRDRLRAGDLLAGTWVIRLPRRPLLPEIAAEADGESFSDVELDAYGIHELETLERVIREAHPPSMATVADMIALRISRPHWSDDGGPDDLAFLHSYYAALRGRLEQRLLLGRRRRDKHDH